ncbi:MAG TPA: hypothetical protein VGS11_12400 [Candidatus Bathyarchaeia archaeon]|nr:hypothetical protein [Candidatus Bathyarchaeia archaeon]
MTPEPEKPSFFVNEKETVDPNVESMHERPSNNTFRGTIPNAPCRRRRKLIVAHKRDKSSNTIVLGLGTAPQKGRPSQNHSFRLDQDTIDGLHAISEKERVNVNALANKALRRYVEYDVLAEKFGLITISKALLRTLFALMTEQQARDLGRKSGHEAGPGFVTFWYKKFDVENTIKAIGKVTSEYGRNFSFDSSFDGKTHVLVMRHESGKNASAYYGESVKAVFAMLGLDCKVEENEDQVTAHVDILPSIKLPPSTPKVVTTST